jgi:hypothetical protein
MAQGMAGAGDREEKESGEVVGDYIWGGVRIYISGLKVPRQCPLVLLVDVTHI